MLNPLDLVWFWGSLGLYGGTALVIPRIWYFAQFKYTPMRLYLLRGGRVLKAQAMSLSCDNYVYWFENY